MPQPTIGRIVHYQLSAQDVKQIAEHRAAVGLAAGKCNAVEAGQVYPAIVVRRWGTSPQSSVNLQVLLDGPDAHWVTSRGEGDQPGTWAWPTRSE